MTSLLGKSIGQLSALLKSKQVSAVDLTSAHLERIEAREKEIDAFLTLLPEEALAAARRADEQIQKCDSAGLSELPPLFGIPVAVKDNMCVLGTRTSCGSKILADFIAPYEATAIANLTQNGAIVVGKTNMDEFAMGSSTENSAFKKTKNPYDLSAVPGGSSGGSAAAVAADFAVVALGSDTGGSIRQPAAFCGVVGMKPTYGTVSRYGLVAYASSLDQIGPFAKNVEDCALTLLAVAGHDGKDSTSLSEPYKNFNPKNQAELTAAFIVKMAKSAPAELLKGKKIGLIKELLGEGIDKEVQDSVHAAASLLTANGACVEEVSLPNSKYALPVYYILATAEASANLSRFDGVRYGHRALAEKDILSMYFASRSQGFGAEVKRRIMLGTYALSTGYYDAYYKKAQQVRRLIVQDFENIFKDYDVVLSPTAPTCAFKFDQNAGDPLQMYLNDIATIPANLAGLPGLSLPGGLNSQGLPIGLQILGSPMGDAVVLEVAHALEAALGLKLSPPQ
jgi:aspartyl-tRNA(Asn)/glutamyl-tRNA(Gln) amidotransferase subunit A